MPVWMWLAAGVLVVGIYYYESKKKSAAASAAAAQASTAQAATTPTAAGDPLLVSYQAGEASGVSTYQAGVTSGISLVDSIMGMFPGGAEQTGLTSQLAGGAYGSGPYGGTGGEPLSPIGSTYTNNAPAISPFQRINSNVEGGALAAAGYPEYELVPGSNTYVEVTGPGGTRLPAFNSIPQGQSSLYYDPFQPPS